MKECSIPGAVLGFVFGGLMCLVFIFGIVEIIGIGNMDIVIGHSLLVAFAAVMGFIGAALMLSDYKKGGIFLSVGAAIALLTFFNIRSIIFFSTTLTTCAAMVTGVIGVVLCFMFRTPAPIKYVYRVPTSEPSRRRAKKIPNTCKPAAVIGFIASSLQVLVFIAFMILSNVIYSVGDPTDSEFDIYLYSIFIFIMSMGAGYTGSAFALKNYKISAILLFANSVLSYILLYLMSTIIFVGLHSACMTVFILCDLATLFVFVITNKDEKPSSATADKNGNAILFYGQPPFVAQPYNNTAAPSVPSETAFPAAPDRAVEETSGSDEENKND